MKVLLIVWIALGLVSSSPVLAQRSRVEKPPASQLAAPVYVQAQAFLQMMKGKTETEINAELRSLGLAMNDTNWSLKGSDGSVVVSELPGSGFFYVTFWPAQAGLTSPETIATMSAHAAKVGFSGPDQLRFVFPGDSMSDSNGTPYATVEEWIYVSVQTGAWTHTTATVRLR